MGRQTVCHDEQDFLRRLLDPSTSDADRQQIVNFYHAKYGTWAYRCLNARLIKYLGKREAENQLGNAQDMLDERIFHVAAFTKCARKYRRELGKKFENFLKQRINWRCGDVAREIRHELRSKGGYTATNPDTLPLDDEAPLDQGKSPEWIEVFYEGLQQYLKENSHSAKALLEVAAYELRYKAYLDPDRMTEGTRKRACDYWDELKLEFFACQEKKRVLEDVELDAAKSECDVGMNKLENSRLALVKEDSSVNLTDIECQASQRDKTKMMSELKSLGRSGLHRKQGLQLQYMIDFKALALARGKLEKARIELEKWKQCRKPWVRSQEEISKLLGSIDQVTVYRYVKYVKDFMDGWMEQNGCCE
jgi:hypothetical protein